jgi:type IV pilus assembly protein PilW
MYLTFSSPSSTHRRQRGFSLVELMVAMGIGMVLVLLISTVMVRQESSRRTLTAGNDATLSGTFLSFMLDRELRSEGSGFASRGGRALGCILNVARNGVQVLPATAALPAPFSSVPVNVPLAAVLVYPGLGANGSDIIGIQQGVAGLGEIPYNVRYNSVTALDLRVNNTVGFRANDLALIQEPNRGCMVQQIAPTFAQSGGDILPMGGNYAAVAVAATAIVDFARVADANILNLGAAPRFQLFGLGTNDRLFSYDLLRLNGGTNADLMGEGVITMRALYGIDNDGNPGTRTVTQWVAPTDADWTPAALSAGTDAARDRLRNILAVRVGLVLRGDLMETADVSPATFTLFAGPSQAVVTLSAEQRRMRVRAVEFTVPVRNYFFP